MCNKCDWSQQLSYLWSCRAQWNGPLFLFSRHQEWKCIIHQHKENFSCCLIKFPFKKSVWIYWESTTLEILCWVWWYSSTTEFSNIWALSNTLGQGLHQLLSLCSILGFSCCNGPVSWVFHWQRHCDSLIQRFISVSLGNSSLSQTR